jgi:hypothetical protein
MTSTSTKKGSRAGVWLFVAAVVAAIVVPVVILERETPEAPQTTPIAGIQAIAGEVRTVPQLPRQRKKQLVTQLSGVLATLYERAFLGSGPTPTAPPSPEPTPATPVDALFTARAREALRAHPDLFRPAPGAHIEEGQVAFSGIATLDGSTPLQALLEVTFKAMGTFEGRTSPIVAMRQQGTLLLLAGPNGWRVDGFDLKFHMEPAQPTPTPEAS